MTGEERPPELPPDRPPKGGKADDRLRQFMAARGLDPASDENDEDSGQAGHDTAACGQTSEEQDEDDG